MSNYSRLDGMICTDDEIARSSLSSKAPDNYTGPAIYCLTRGQSIGLAVGIDAIPGQFSVEAGTLSIVAVLFLLLLILINARRFRWRPIQQPADAYVLSLFVFDMFQGVGGVINAKWVHEGKVYTGPFCTLQGAIQQLGETGVALSTLAITLHTFRVVWWSKGAHDTRISYFAIAGISLLVILMVVIGVGVHTKHDARFYETPTPYWCWIGGHYGPERLGMEYFWMWFTLFSSIILYVPLYFLHRRNITVNKEKWWKFSIHRRIKDSDSSHTPSHNSSHTSPLVMLLYPAVYCATVLPATVARWTQFVQQSHHQNIITPSAATFFTEIVYRSSGFINIILYLRTRPELLSLGHVAGERAPSEISLLVAAQEHINKNKKVTGNGDNIPTLNVAGTPVEEVRQPQRRTRRSERRGSSCGLRALEEAGWDLPGLPESSIADPGLGHLYTRSRI